LVSPHSGAGERALADGLRDDAREMIRDPNLKICAVAVAMMVFLVFGCGDGEKPYTPEEFVQEANANGAGIALGGPLDSATELEIYDVQVDLGVAPPDESASSGGSQRLPGAAHTHGGGSLAVAPGIEEAESEHERCEVAPSLVCYRAANVVLRLEEPPPADQARIDAAIATMSTRE